jgi:hypothetical protein
MEKKHCIFFGNCACDGILKFLTCSNFSDKFTFDKFANWELMKTGKPIDRALLQKADVVIYQPLSDVHNCYSTNRTNPDSFLNLLSPNCATISFPRIHNNALFPVFNKRRNGPEFYGKINNNVRTIEELTYLYDNDMIDYDFENRSQQNYAISKFKEMDCDIKIADTLWANLSNEKLFLTQDHPTSFVFDVITKQICDHLDITYDSEKAATYVKDENITGLNDSVYHRPSNQYPISRYAIKHYNFTYVIKEDPDADKFYRDRTAEFLNFKL